MEVITTAKYVRTSPKKLRIMSKGLQNLKAEEAITRLTFMGKIVADPLINVLKTGIADATNNFNVPKENLIIKSIDISGGNRFKRWRPVSRGQAHAYVRQTSHIKIILEG